MSCSLAPLSEVSGSATGIQIVVHLYWKAGGGVGVNGGVSNDT